jgi:hypothetical protein
MTPHNQTTDNKMPESSSTKPKLWHYLPALSAIAGVAAVTAGSAAVRVTRQRTTKGRGLIVACLDKAQPGTRTEWKLSWSWGIPYLDSEQQPPVLTLGWPTESPGWTSVIRYLDPDTAA